MPISYLPKAAVAASLPRDVRPQIASSCAQPPAGDGWLHEPKHDGWRLISILDGNGAVKLLSRQGLDHTRLFGTSFRELTATRRAMVLDGEIAVPDERGVTHIDGLNDAMGSRRSDGLAYFAFDLLHLDGHDLRRCPIEERKAVLRRVIGDARCERRGRFNCGLSYYCLLRRCATSWDDQP
jgi:bifunctional non-homologous end joining protein LigD